MIVKKVKATKQGWLVSLVNGEIELPLDFDSSTEIGSSVQEWFQVNKAEPLYTVEEKKALEKKVKFNRAIKAGKTSKDGVIWLNKDLAIEFHSKLSTTIILDDKKMLWKDVNGKVIELTVAKAKGYLREANAELNKAFFGREK